LREAQVRQVLFDEFAEAQTFVQLPHQNPATIGGDPRSPEIDLRCSIE
jgi:hypothetical protein